MRRPYDYLPMITPDMVAGVQQVSEDICIDYLREQQPSLYTIMSHNALSTEEYAAKFWATAGLTYAVLDTAFTQDYGAIYGFDHLPPMDTSVLREHFEELPFGEPGRLSDDFEAQQEGLENKALTQAILQQWVRPSHLQDSPEDEPHFFRALAGASTLMFLVNAESRRVSQILGQGDFPSS